MKNQVMYHPSGKIELVAKDAVFLPNVTEGFYKVKHVHIGMGTALEIHKDTEVSIPRGSRKLTEEYIDVPFVDEFFSDSCRQLHRDLGMTHKLGLLLYGQAGTGKTTMSYSLAQNFIHTQQAVVVTVRDVNEYNFVLEFLKEIKKSQGDFMSVTIFDECENSMREYEEFMKRELDSTYSLGNHLNLFTTNYIDRIPSAIKDRESRIRFSTEVFGVKDEIAVFEILDGMNSNLGEKVRLPQDRVQKMVKDLVSKTLDNIKNRFIDETFTYNWEQKLSEKS